MVSRRLFLTAAVALVACKSTRPPLTPDGVTAAAGDQSVTIHWNAAAGAIGYVVYYNGDDKPVVAAASSSSIQTLDTSTTVTGLVNARKYRFAVQARNGAGSSPLSAEASAVPAAAQALAVSVVPADSAGSVSRAPTIQATFSRPVRPETVTTAVASNSCADASFQVSSDNFATCIQMQRAPVPSNGNATYSVSPAVALTGGTKYQVRITTAVVEPIGGTLASAVNSGFTTAAALALASTVPADGAALISLHPSITLRFNRPVRPGSLSTNAGLTSCAGSVLLSRAADNFALCVPLTGAAGADGSTYTLSPNVTLAGATQYQLKVTADAQDADGVGPSGPLVIGFSTDVELTVGGLVPAQGSSGAALNAPVSISFNRPVDPATVSTNTADGRCTGSLQVSSDGFLTCVQMAAAPAASDSNRTFTVAPLGTLAPLTVYSVRVTTAVADPTGVPLGAVFTGAGFSTNVALTVISVNPIEGALAVPLSTSIAITFRRPALPASITVATSGTACTGSLQLSGDNFQTCVAMAAQPSALNGNLTFTATPAALLSPSAAYRLRVTTGARDADGVALAAPFTSAIGFVTDGPFAVLSVSPTDGAGAVPLNAPIVVTFDRAITLASLTVNTADTACGTFALQLSADNFATCVPFSAAPSAANGNRTFTATPAALLAGGQTYRLRVTTAVTDSKAVPLPATFTTAAGFTTAAALAVTSTSPAGGDTSVALNPAISVRFNRAPTVSSLTTNTADGSCATGSLQLSKASDAFAPGTCVRFAAAPVGSGFNQVFTATPATTLAPSTAYLIRVTTSASDGDGVPLGAAFTSGAFTTAPALAATLAAPAGLTAVALNTPIAIAFNKPASPGSITVKTSTSDPSCSGSLQLSSDNFATCVAMSGVPAASNGNATFTAQPRALLAPSTSYAVRVTTAALDSTSVPLAAAFTSATFTTNVAEGIASSTPANGASAVAINTAVSITFVRATLPASMTTNTAGGACSGALQLSSDGFSSCVRMAAAPAGSNANQTWTFTPAGLLAPSTNYQLRVTAAAQDADGAPLPPLSVASFRTDGPLLVSAPLDGQTGVALNTGAAGAVFNKPVQRASVTVNTADSRCSGSLQLSRAADNFSLCVRMATQPTPSASDTTWLLTPAAPLDGSTTYLLRVTTAVLDLNGVPLPAAYTTPAGFTTDLALAVASVFPADGTGSVALNSAFSVTFNKPALALTGNLDSQCSGSLQLSSDGFTTCVPLQAAPASSNGGATYSARPAAPLQGGTLYRLRVTTAAQDLAQVALGAAFTSGGFVTDAALAVLSTSPANGTAAVTRNSPISVTFNKAADPASLTTTLGASTACGSFQVSTDPAFATCIAMAAQPSPDASAKTFTATPATFLPASTAIYVRIGTGARDLAGVALAAPSTAARFTTDAALAVTQITPANNASAVALNAPIQVTFNKAAQLSVNSTDNSCATGSLQVSGDGFQTCVQMARPAASSNGGTTFTAQPASTLAALATYQVRITSGARDLTGVAFTGFTSSFSTDAAIAVAATAPADMDAGVPLSSTITVSFNKPAAPMSLTTNTDGTSCSGSLQLSADGFASCVRMASQPSADPTNQSFTAAPLAPLAGTTTYQLRVTTGVTDAAGVAMAFVNLTSFTTEAALAVVSTSPANGASGVSVTSPIAVTFNKGIQLATLTFNSDTLCSGSLQLSADNFASCVPLIGPPASAGANAWQIRPANPLAPSTTFRIRVTSGLTDTGQVPLAATFTTPNGFTTEPRIAVVGVVPADGATNVATGSTVAVVFNKVPYGLSVNTNDASCGAETLQVSSDGFTTCVRMASLTASADQLTWTATPAAPLAAGATFQIRVAQGVQDATGVTLISNFQTPRGFTTVPPPALSVSVPLDGAATDQPLNVPVQINFNRAVNAATLTTNAGCTGSLQLSRQADNFTACVAATLSLQGATGVQLIPSAPLASATRYLVRVTTAVQDASGTALAAQYTSPTGFRTKPALAATVSPAAGATGVARTAQITVSFNRAASGATVGGSSTCGGTLQVSSNGFTSCIPVALAADAASQIFTLTPAVNLPGNAAIQVRIKGSISDSDGVPLGADTTTASFQTSPAMTVSSTPADGAPAVAASSSVVVSFSSPPLAGTVTGGCTGSVTLTSGASCVAASGPVVSPDGKTFTFTPSATLVAGQQYAIGVSTAVKDAQGAALDTAYRALFTVATPPANPSLAAPAVALQKITLSWPNPGGTYDHANVYSRATGAGSYALLGSTAAGGTSFAATALPFRSYDFKVTSLDAAGNESSGATVANVATAFTGTAADWLPGQAAAGLGTGRFRFTWTDTDFVAAVSTQADAKLLSTTNPDALWIAFDTDPATDATGEWSSTTVGANNVIWPFKANYVVELVLTGAASSAVNARPSGGSFAALATASFNGALDEVRIPRAAIGNPAGAVRFALVAVNKSNGYVYDLAPANASATDVTGYHASLTSGFAPGSASWTTAATAASVASSPLSSAAALVTLSVKGLGAGPTVKVRGGLAPFDLNDLTLSSYALLDNGTHGDAVAGDGTYTGVFNLGASTQELFFRFDDGASSEFAGGKDRVWTLGGSTEAVPTVTFKTAYSATHGFQLTFNVTQTAGVPTQVLGSTSELGTWTIGSGKPLTQVGASNVYSTGAVTFGAHDFISSPLLFKAYTNAWENDPNGSLDDDVLNRRALSWSFNATQGF